MVRPCGQGPACFPLVDLFRVYTARVSTLGLNVGVCVRVCVVPGVCAHPSVPIAAVDQAPGPWREARSPWAVHGPAERREWFPFFQVRPHPRPDPSCPPWPFQVDPRQECCWPLPPQTKGRQAPWGAVGGPDPRPQEKREEVFCGLRPRPLVATTLHLLPGGHEAPPGVPVALPFPGPRGGCWLAQDHSPSLLYL